MAMGMYDVFVTLVSYAMRIGASTYLADENSLSRPLPSQPYFQSRNTFIKSGNRCPIGL